VANSRTGTSELMLISAMLNLRDHITPAARGVTEEMFYAYREGFSWIEGYISQYGKTPSLAAFRSRFEDIPVRRGVDDLELFIEEVRENYSRQVLLKGLDSVTSTLKRGDVQKAIRMLSSASISAEASLLGHEGDGNIFTDYEDIRREVIDRKLRRAKTGFAGIPTGIPTLDELTGGIQPGWFVVVTARAGVGKTRTLIRMACAAAFSGFSVQYDALEQTRAEIAMQVHSFASSEFGLGIFRSLDLAQGTGYETSEYSDFLRKLSERVAGKLHVADNRRGRIAAATISAQIERNKADVVLLDYITLVEGAEDWQSLSNLSTNIKQTAQRYGIPIITAAQINRNGARSKDQDLDDIAGADRIGQDADLVINVQQFSQSVVVMHVVKFRHGPKGWRFYMKFDPNQGVMEEITYDQACDLRDKDIAKEDDTKKKGKFVPRKKGSFEQTAKQKKEADTLSAQEARRSAESRALRPKRPGQRPTAQHSPQTRTVRRRRHDQ
jgi:replicative DNA helicase